MSILIKGMEMPKDCNKCPMTVDGYCRIIGYPNGDAIIKRYKPLWCPLVEVPKHGRLIDADALETEWEVLDEDGCVEMEYYSIEAIENAPTIIEAEE